MIYYGIIETNKIFHVVDGVGEILGDAISHILKNIILFVVQ